MKRSEINKYIEQAKELFAQAGFYLPLFAFWSPGDWKSKGAEADEVRENAYKPPVWSLDLKVEGSSSFGLAL